MFPVDFSSSKMNFRVLDFPNEYSLSYLIESTILVNNFPLSQKSTCSPASHLSVHVWVSYIIIWLAKFPHSDWLILTILFWLRRYIHLGCCIEVNVKIRRREQVPKFSATGNPVCDGCHMRSRKCLPFRSTWFHLWFS